MSSKPFAEGLAELARANERKRDAALLRATTELFVLDVNHDRDEVKRYSELATHFLPKVSLADRIFVAERLSICGDAPMHVLRMLARDTVEVAAPILLHSPALLTIDLLTIIAATGPEHHRLISRRATLAPDVRRALRLTGDAEVLANLEHGGISEAPTSATATPRLDAWDFLALDRKARLRIIAGVASNPPAATGTADRRLDQAFRSILGAAQIVGFARSGQLARIVATISEALELPSDLVAGAVNDKGGELLALMLKALRLDDNQARQVMLLASPSGRDVQTFFPLSDLYSGMEPYVAEALVAEWREAARPRRAGHQPHFADTLGRRRGDGAAAPAQQQERRDRDEPQARRA